MIARPTLYMFRHALALLACLALCAGIVATDPGCAATPAQIQTGTNTAIDLTNAICAIAADSPVGQPYTDVICTIAQGVEQVVSVLVGSDASPTAVTESVPVESIRLRMPTPDAQSFVRAHTAKRGQ